jgi:glucan phosphoethanolaminetransferase (alkaline phosphatase superfamily)
MNRVIQYSPYIPSEGSRVESWMFPLFIAAFRAPKLEVLIVVIALAMIAAMAYFMYLMITRVISIYAERAWGRKTHTAKTLWWWARGMLAAEVIVVLCAASDDAAFIGLGANLQAIATLIFVVAVSFIDWRAERQGYQQPQLPEKTLSDIVTPEAFAPPQE